MKDYEIAIGLEVHAELKTDAKIFCGCKNSFGAEPNTQVCPVCTGMPGTLPTLNSKAVEYTVKMGHALNCKINNISHLDRKNYFYPDLPKAYQISQADIPICGRGYLDIFVHGSEKRVGITRIHLEEDAGKLMHSESSSGSLIDFNRCGVPLIEIVTEPDMRSSAEAKSFLETIKMILKYLDISDCKMQEGSIRCDVNVSVREKGSQKLGTRCEMKNVNSFSAAVRGIEYEAARQIEILKSGGVIEQETRRWDDIKGKSFVMRTKEDAQDYRFFPEPDLCSIVIGDECIQEIKNSIPELPNTKIRRYTKEHGLPFTDAVLIAEDFEKALLYDKCSELRKCSNRSICNWIITDITKYLNDTGKSISETKLTAEKLTSLIAAIDCKTVSNSAAKQVLGVILTEGGEPEEIIQQLGLAQNSDKEYLKNLVKGVLEANKKSVSDYKNGKTNALGYLVGQCMKKSGGRANPAIIRELAEEELKK